MVVWNMTKYFKDTIKSNGEFWIVQKISEDEYKIIYRTDYFTRKVGEILDKERTFDDCNGYRKIEEISENEAFVYLI